MSSLFMISLSPYIFLCLPEEVVNIGGLIAAARFVGRVWLCVRLLVGCLVGVLVCWVLMLLIGCDLSGCGWE